MTATPTTLRARTDDMERTTMRMRTTSPSTVMAFTLALLAPTLLVAAPGPAFESVLQPYESVRAALVADDFAASREPARALEEAIGALGDLTAETAGVPVGKLDEVRALLPELRGAAGELPAAGDLQETRDAFYALSKPLVRWRQAAGDGPAVVYCSMKKRSWLQPGDADVGNPYYGQQMARCGDVVSKDSATAGD